MQSHRPTIKDVAKRAGVSFKTVSRVINGQEGVRAEVRARVRRAVSDLGYVVNYSARSLASGRNRTIGVVIPRITDPRSFDLLHHIGEVSEQYKTGVIILTRPILSDELAMSNFIGHGIVGSLLLIAPRNLLQYLPMVRALNIPTVVCESPFVDQEGCLLEVGLSCIASDNRGGALRGVEYLIALGHRRIAFVGGGDSAQSRLRLLGYRDALAQNGLAADEAYVRQGDWSWESGHEQAEQLLGLPAPPTAIACANDNMALGVMRAVDERGLHVPEHMSILGFDDIPAASFSDPPLSTIRQPAHEMVQRAIELLVHAMDGSDVSPTTYILPTQLVERQSCGSPPASTWR